MVCIPLQSWRLPCKKVSLLAMIAGSFHQPFLAGMIANRTIPLFDIAKPSQGRPENSKSAKRAGLAGQQ